MSTSRSFWVYGGRESAAVPLRPRDLGVPPSAAKGGAASNWDVSKTGQGWASPQRRGLALASSTHGDQNPRPVAESATRTGHPRGLKWGNAGPAPDRRRLKTQSATVPRPASRKPREAGHPRFLLCQR